jgi:hypothetical protein
MSGPWGQAMTAALSLLGVAGGVLGTLTVQRSANRRDDHKQANDLLARLISASGAIQAQIAIYRLRTNRRARLLALGWALLELGAAHAGGNWMRGAADGVRELRKWEMDESARFSDRIVAPAAEITATLVHLSQMSPGLKQAAINTTEALDEVWKAGKPEAIKPAEAAKVAGDGLAKAIGGVRRAVDAFTAR